MALKKIVLDPVRWDRGGDERGGADVYLLHPTTQKMCCMGFAALQFGVKKEEILKCPSFDESPSIVLQRLVRKYDLQGLYELNDSYTATREISDEERVANLNAEARKQKLPFRFVLKTSKKKGASKK